MSQHDYVISNSDGATVRADINSALGAVQSQNSSSVAPSATVAYMPWANTSATAVMVRDAGDANFQYVYDVSTTGCAPYVRGVILESPAHLDKAQSFTAAQRASMASVAYASTITLNTSAYNDAAITLTGSATVGAPSKAVKGQSGSIFLKQDGTGSRSYVFNSVWKFVGGTAPTPTATSSATDRVDYTVMSSSEIHAVQSADVK